jgi:hypothetical protein
MMNWKGCERKSRDLNEGTIPSICFERVTETMKTSVRTADIRVEN